MAGWHHWLDGHEFEQIWELVMDREAWCAAVHGVTKSQTQLSDWTGLNMFTFLYRRITVFPLEWAKFFLRSQSVQSCAILCDSMDCSMPGLPVHHQLPEFTQTHIHWVSDTIQPSHPPSSPSPPAFNLSQHQGLFKWVISSRQVAKVLEFQV